MLVKLLLQDTVFCPVPCRISHTLRYPSFAGLQWQSFKMDMFLLMWLIILGVMGVMTFAGVFILLVPVIDPERSGHD